MERHPNPLRRLARALGLRSRKPTLMLAFAVIMAGGAVTAAAALTGDAPVASADTPTTLTPTSSPSGTATLTPSATPTSTSATSTPGGDGVDSGSASGDDATATPTGSGASSPTGIHTAVSPHEDGNGCDDIIHAEDRTPGPGGPVGCTVGSSGDHRKNGASASSTSTSTPTGTATSAATATASASASATEGHDDPHANGHGCDDVNPAVIDGAPSHGGPVGCTVGNSGDHRQNGAKSTSTATSTATATAAASTAAADATSAGRGNGNGGGKKSK